jgi:hypothetical protein
MAVPDESGPDESGPNVSDPSVSGRVFGMNEIVYNIDTFVQAVLIQYDPRERGPGDLNKDDL